MKAARLNAITTAASPDKPNTRTTFTWRVCASLSPASRIQALANRIGEYQRPPSRKVTRADAQLRQAFARVQTLRERFSSVRARELEGALTAPARFRQRWIARKAGAFVAVPVEQVAYFVSLDKLTFMVEFDATRHLLDGSLGDVERELDPRLFFRVNRQMVVAARAVARWSAGAKGRVVLELRPRSDGEVQISQERAAAFREWIAR